MSVFLLEGCLKVRFTILAGTVHYLGRYLAGKWGLGLLGEGRVKVWLFYEEGC